eukprot:5354434-Pleurochrysis_carterae.AAC.1
MTAADSEDLCSRPLAICLVKGKIEIKKEKAKENGVVFAAVVRTFSHLPPLSSLSAWVGGDKGRVFGRECWSGPWLGVVMAPCITVAVLVAMRRCA